ncbi:hypothetical protein HOLleu_36957 [Holothuria leucospilota]|uniref:Uncharacterized protein n=1 Tax=Holothuria leucospilota TaxID=206669 RepID=A0A9Q0YQ42_HOLLE|nr:hypothetical protein HOLleu_36957 [Holothuria leucospilota]
MGRRLRDQLPMTSDLLKHQLIEKSTGEKILQRQRTQKKYYDRRASPPQNFAVDDRVRACNEQLKTWNRAVVTEQTGMPRSFVVHTDRS